MNNRLYTLLEVSGIPVGLQQRFREAGFDVHRSAMQRGYEVLLTPELSTIALREIRPFLPQSCVISGCTDYPTNHIHLVKWGGTEVTFVIYGKWYAMPVRMAAPILEKVLEAGEAAHQL